MTNDLPGAQSAVTIIVQVAMQDGLTCIEIGLAAPDPKWEETGTPIAVGSNNAAPSRVAAQACTKQAWQTGLWKRVFGYDTGASQQ